MNKDKIKKGSINQNQQKRIEWAYKKLWKIYRKKGLWLSFYTFYRNLTCPIKRIFQLIPKGKKYIDLGCGYGFISLGVALVFQDADIIGIDVIKSKIELSNKLAKDAGIKNVKFQVEDIRKETAGSADIILVIDFFSPLAF